MTEILLTKASWNWYSGTMCGIPVNYSKHKTAQHIFRHLSYYFLYKYLYGFGGYVK